LRTAAAFGAGLRGIKNAKNQKQKQKQKNKTKKKPEKIKYNQLIRFSTTVVLI
jgi:hypothetical protein